MNNTNNINITEKNLYEILEVNVDATPIQIKRSYHRLCLLHHPDKNVNKTVKSDHKIKQINMAYEILSDKSKRDEYDMSKPSKNKTFATFDEYFKEQETLFNDLTSIFSTIIKNKIVNHYNENYNEILKI